MASITNDKSGLHRILFTRPVDGSRVAIRLGRMKVKDLRTVKANVEALVACAIAGTSMPDDVARWVSEIGDRLHGAIAEHGLVNARRRMQLGEFLKGYRDRRKDVKQGTSINYRTITNRLLAYFPADRYLHEITPGDADGWLIYLKSEYAGATVGKSIKQARQFFRDAVRRGLLTRNPFADVIAPPQTNKARLRFIPIDAVQKVIDQATDHEWRLLIALSRFGGLRCPSEHLALTWRDINWEAGKFRVDSPKTGERWVPIFPELRPFLAESLEQAEDGAVHVITRYRDAKCNLRTSFVRLIRKAGLTPWPRLFQNLRASRETELMRTYPAPVVCEWIGNTLAVALAHYHQMLDSDYEKAARNRTQNSEESGGKPGKSDGGNVEKSLVFVGKSKESAEMSMTPTGFEPVSRP